VNCYRTEDKTPEMEFHPYKDDDARAQVEALCKVRAERDAARVEAALARVRADARSGANLMPAILEAVKAYASVGEITQVLVGVFGRYREPVRF
jgi:methylmalonyl-CoA mutase N-terminal domain/subunit